MEATCSENDFVVLSLLEERKKYILGLSNPKNKTRARRVSPAGEGAVELSRSLSGVQDVSGPI